MKKSSQELLQQMQAGSERALAQVLTLIENSAPESVELLEALYPKAGKAQVIGITGSPGAGKSTLVDRLTELFVANGKRVAILAVDPSSPFTGGALLGDRVRMARSAPVHSVFIRSMASRGSLGGLAPRTFDVVMTLDAVGYDVVLIETVGVGQGEVEIVRLADTVVVVLVPGMGDSVQAFKAGILEIADVFVINKADYPGVDKLRKDLLSLLALSQAPWNPPILDTQANEGKGISELVEQVGKHRSWSESAGAFQERRRERRQWAFLRELSEQATSRALRQLETAGEYENLLARVLTGELPPSRAASIALSSK